MAERTGISWCDSTFNPWIGCTKISPACDHCYAERDFDLRRHVAKWGAGQPRHRTSVANWNQVERWNARPFAQCDACGWRGESSFAGLGDVCPQCREELRPVRRRVFCASLGDVFDNEVDPEWRADLFSLIEATPNLDWLLLTKRIGNAERLACEAASYFEVGDTNPSVWACGAWPSNVWLGATVCNQEEADRDIPKLLAVPAAVRFLSIEPMLGPISMRWLPAWPENAPNVALSPSLTTGHLDGLKRIDWIICGGESGKNARPIHSDWVRSLRDQCVEAGVPFFFKQWGEFAPVGNTRDDGVLTDFVGMSRVGLKVAGRLLDGHEHNEFPEAA